MYDDPQLQDLSEKAKAISQQFAARAQELYPLGSHVSFFRGRGLVSAMVISAVEPESGASARVRVRNDKTSKDYWLQISTLNRREK